MANFSLTTASNLFKIKYGKLSDNVFNSANVALGRVKKEDDFTGKRMDVAVPTSFSGGVGSGLLPTANYAAYEDAQLSAKKVYAVVEIDRESVKASENDEGAFVRLTKHAVGKTVESFSRNMSRILFNDGTAALGTLNANATGSAAAPSVIISAATWKEANWEEKDYINFGTDAAVFEIVSVTPATRAVLLSRISGSLDLTSSGSGLVAYMQNSKDLDPMGLKGVCDATSGTLYGITVARRWKAFQKAVTSGLTTDYMNEVMLGVEKQSGKVPNMILTSYTQYRKLLNILEDQKQYVIDPRSPELKGKVSFRGVEFMSNAGPVGVFAERFVEDDRMYFLNDNYITIKRRPGGFQWFEDDGSVFLRGTSTDTYGARYGGYCEIYAPPSFHGVLTGLTT